MSEVCWCGKSPPCQGAARKVIGCAIVTTPEDIKKDTYVDRMAERRYKTWLESLKDHGP